MLVACIALDMERAVICRMAASYTSSDNRFAVERRRTMAISINLTVAGVARVLDADDPQTPLHAAHRAFHKRS